jgi:signal transduction protein with GAF and PtsI domain
VDQQQQQQVPSGESGEAAFEAKYNSLKNRFRKMEDSYRRELDTLHEEIAVLQDRMKKLDAAR